MRGLAILGLLVFLSGCSSMTPLEELEKQAMLTGDWSAVERRERIIAKRRARNAPMCPPGAVALCVDGAGRNKCSCVGSSAMHTLVGN